MNRRHFLPALLILPFSALALTARELAFAPVVSGTPLRFPRDLGAHPDFRIEWWYVTGHLSARSDRLGFQLTFFRTRNPREWGNPSAFAPRQILFAHAALTDVRAMQLLQAERSARAGLGLAGARSGDTDVWMDRWRLVRDGEAYRATAGDAAFTLDLRLSRTAPVLLQGPGGVSRKGSLTREASFYLSEPQLAVTGSVRRGKREDAVKGVAWLDHEWSSEPLNPGVHGWDWTGINLTDGGALMAFRMRRRDGGVRWAGGTLRDSRGRVRHFTPAEIAMTPVRTWRSPRTGIAYPVEMEVRAAERTWTLKPLIDAQEIDARRSTRTVYWEGAVDAFENGNPAGRGYLELTGYGEALRY
jgi:predicted secreted hydrolase